MDLDRIIEQMHAERERLGVSIRAMELLMAAGVKNTAFSPRRLAAVAAKRSARPRRANPKTAGQERSRQSA